MQVENLKILNFEDVVLNVCNTNSSIGCYQFDGDKDCFVSCCNCNNKKENKYLSCSEREFVLSDSDLDYLKKLCKNKNCNFLKLIYITCNISASSDFWNDCNYIQSIQITNESRFCVMTYYDLLNNMENKYRPLLEHIPYLLTFAQAYYM